MECEIAGCNMDGSWIQTIELTNKIFKKPVSATVRVCARHIGALDGARCVIKDKRYDDDGASERT